MRALAVDSGLHGLVVYVADLEQRTLVPLPISDEEEQEAAARPSLAIDATVAGQTPAETVRLLSLAVLAHQKEMLQDDATLLLVSWTGAATSGP